MLQSEMDDDDRPRGNPGHGSSGARIGAAGTLAAESLDGYSLDELDARVAALEAEIGRVRDHRERTSSHMVAADALFRRKS